MMRAIYIFQDDKWQLVAKFAVKHLPSAPSNWPQEIADWFESQGIKTRIQNEPE